MADASVTNNVASKSTNKKVEAKKDCQAKLPPSVSTKRKVQAKKISKVVAKKIKKRACRLCGKTKKLTKTECCDNWICDDSHKYRLFSFALNSCYRNHHRYSSCAYHHNERHEGKWRDCEKCKENSNYDFDFDEVTCVGCGLKSETIQNFAFQVKKDFYCNKNECLKKLKTSPNGTKRKVEIKKTSRVVAKKVKKACRLCRKTKKLTKTECCNNWICDDSHKYRLFSFALNSCYRNHHRYSSCAYHHNERLEGKWRDCEKCKENCYDFDFDEVTCVSCGSKSETMEDISFQIKKDFYCKKDECQKKAKPSLFKGTKNKVEAKNENRAVGKKIKKACRLCKKNRKLTITECCNNWICEDSYSIRYGNYGCSRDHHRYSVCKLHFNEGHEGKWQDCKECMDVGPMDYDFEDITCVSCGFKSQTTEDFAFQLNDDFYCTKDECKAKGKPPPSKCTKRKVEATSPDGMKKTKTCLPLIGKNQDADKNK